MQAHMLLGEEDLLLWSAAFTLPPTLLFEMTAFKAVIIVATIDVEMLLDVCIIGISEITLPNGMIPNVRIQIRTILVLFLSDLLKKLISGLCKYLCVFHEF